LAIESNVSASIYASDGRRPSPELHRIFAFRRTDSDDNARATSKITAPSAVCDRDIAYRKLQPSHLVSVSSSTHTAYGAGRIRPTLEFGDDPRGLNAWSQPTNGHLANGRRKGLLLWSIKVREAAFVKLPALAVKRCPECRSLGIKLV
jgi:hypothetical protein